MLNKRLIVRIACLPHGGHRRDDLPGHRMSGIDRGYSIRKHPLIVILESIISTFYRRNGRSHDGILQPSVDRPRQSQPGWLRPTLFIFAAGHPHQPDTTVSVQSGSVLEPPWRIEVSENGRCANGAYARYLTPGFDDRIFAGIRTELFLRDLDLLFGGVVTNPEHVQLGFQDRIVEL